MATGKEKYTGKTTGPTIIMDDDWSRDLREAERMAQQIRKQNAQGKKTKKTK